MKGRGPGKSLTRGPSFDGDLAAHFFHGLLDGFGFALGDAFLDGLGSSFHKSFGFAQAEASGLADSLQHLDLGRIFVAIEDDIELGLLFDGFSGSRRGSRHHHASRSSSRHTEGLFDLLYKLGSFKQRESLQ